MADTPDGRGANRSDEQRLSRRRLLRRSAAVAGAMGIGAGAVDTVAAKPGQAGAPGRGGEALVRPADFRSDERFTISGRVDADQDFYYLPFECNEGNGHPIALVGWYFSYRDEDETRLVYTRDNNVATEGVVYNWNGSSKVCDSSAFVPNDGTIPIVQTQIRARSE